MNLIGNLNLGYNSFWSNVENKIYEQQRGNFMLIKGWNSFIFTKETAIWASNNKYTKTSPNLLVVSNHFSYIRSIFPQISNTHTSELCLYLP